MRQHAVDAIQVLVHVFEEQQRTVEVREIGRADQALQQRQVAAGERAFRHAAPDGDDPVRLRHEDVGGQRERLECAGWRGIGQHPREMPAGEERHLRSGGGRVEGDHARPADDRRQQRRDVGVSDHRTRPPRERLEVDAVEDAGHAIAAANAPDGVDRRIAERRVEVGQARVVGAGEVAVVPAGVRAHDRFVIQRTAERLGAC